MCFGLFLSPMLFWPAMAPADSRTILLRFRVEWIVKSGLSSLSCILDSDFRLLLLNKSFEYKYLYSDLLNWCWAMKYCSYTSVPFAGNILMYPPLRSSSSNVSNSTSLCFPGILLIRCNSCLWISDKSESSYSRLIELFKDPCLAGPS